MTCVEFVFFLLLGKMLSLKSKVKTKNRLEIDLSTKELLPKPELILLAKEQPLPAVSRLSIGYESTMTEMNSNKKTHLNA